MARLLRSRSEREERGLFVCEGARLCQDAAASGVALRELYLAPGVLEKYPFLDTACKQAGAVYGISPEISRKLSDTKSPQGVYALCGKLDNRQSPATIKGGGRIGRYVLLCSLQDPGNLGTVLRTAEAFGLDGLFVSADCPDLYSPKVLRSSMGGVFRLPVTQCEDMGGTVEELRERGVKVYAAALDGPSVPLSRLSGAESVAVLIGNEGNGLPEALIARCDATVTIPMAGRAESLNAGIAAAVLMWEMGKPNGY